MLETSSFTKNSDSQIFGNFFSLFFPTAFSLICSQSTKCKQTMGAKMTIRISFKIIRTKIKSYSVTQNNVVIEFTGAENVPWGLITPFDNLIYFCVNNNLYNLSIHLYSILTPYPSQQQERSQHPVFFKSWEVPKTLSNNYFSVILFLKSEKIK